MFPALLTVGFNRQPIASARIHRYDMQTCQSNVISSRSNSCEGFAMPFWRTYNHLVWATKNRDPIIDTNIEDRLFPYLIKKAGETAVNVYAINGWTDHIHLIVSIPPKWSVADVVKRLKGASAYYLNQAFERNERFTWQRGYGVLTLGERQRSTAGKYVNRQKEHHRQNTTNSWLERVYEFDDGPTAIEGSGDGSLREPAAHYSVGSDGNTSEFPF